MTANTPASRKAKGRLCAQEIRSTMLGAAHRVHLDLHPDDIAVTSSSVTGEDLKLSPRAQSVFPVSIEAKCKERLNVWEAIEQAEGHKRNEGIEPLVVFRRNRTKLRAIIDFDRLLSLMLDAREWREISKISSPRT